MCANDSAISHDDAICLAIPRDRPPDEMTTKDLGWRAGKRCEQSVAGMCRLHRIEVDRRGPAGMRHLAGMVCDVADEQGRLARRPDVDA